MIEGRKVLAVTLARKGSKSIPNKNMKLLGGIPLVQWTQMEAMRSKFIDKYVVATDDFNMMAWCRHTNTEYFVRSATFAQDHSKSSDALQECVNGVRLIDETDYDIIVELMCTNPFKTAEDIDGVISKLHYKNTSAVVSVVRLDEHHPARIKYLDQNDVMIDFYPEVPESRRQDLKPTAYIRNGSIYAMEREFLYDTDQRYDKESLAYVMPQDRTVNLDTEIDWRVAEQIVKII